MTVDEARAVFLSLFPLPYNAQVRTEDLKEGGKVREELGEGERNGDRKKVNREKSRNEQRKRKRKKWKERRRNGQRRTGGGIEKQRGETREEGRK